MGEDSQFIAQNEKRSMDTRLSRKIIDDMRVAGKCKTVASFRSLWCKRVDIYLVVKRLSANDDDSDLFRNN